MRLKRTRRGIGWTGTCAGPNAVTSAEYGSFGAYCNLPNHELNWPGAVAVGPTGPYVQPAGYTPFSQLPPALLAQLSPDAVNVAVSCPSGQVNQNGKCVTPALVAVDCHAQPWLCPVVTPASMQQAGTLLTPSAAVTQNPQAAQTRVNSGTPRVSMANDGTPVVNTSGLPSVSAVVSASSSSTGILLGVAALAAFFMLRGSK